MRHSKLILVAITLLLLFASFLSVPALSGENPWDADDGGGTTGSPSDSADNDAGIIPDLSTGLEPGTPYSVDDKLNWFSGLMKRMSNFIVERYYKWASPKAQVKTAY